MKSTASQTTMDRNSRVILFAVFFVSGACGLVHEVVWTRLFTHVMGGSTYALTLVLSVFMGGLALGGIVAGRMVDQIRFSPLKVLVWIEAGIGLSALAMPWLIDLAQPLYGMAYAAAGHSFTRLTLVRFGFSALLLILPTSLMGATLPVMTRLFAFSGGHTGRLAGKLYSINTFGAVTGVILAGFVFLPRLGLANTIMAASGGNFIVCFFFIALLKQNLFLNKSCVEAARNSSIQEAHPPLTDIVKHKGTLTILLLGYGLSGMAALSYEVAWTRVLAMMVGSSTYAFTLILSAFVAGLAIGSGIFSRFVPKIRHPLAIMGFIQVVMGLAALAVVPLMGGLPFFLTGIIARYSSSFWMLQVVEFGLILSITLVPTLLMGASFPLATHIFSLHKKGIGESVGSVYGANTIGTIFGSALTGLALIPLLGTQKTIYAAAGLNLCVAILFLWKSTMFKSSQTRAPAMAFPVALMLMIMVLLPSWNTNFLTFAPFYEAIHLAPKLISSKHELKKLADRQTVLFHKDGPDTTVTVKEFKDNSRVLYINGKPDASSHGDLPSQLLVAHLPLILHPDPKDTLVVGLASGITLGAATLHPTEHIDCLEISPTMVEASHYFDAFNYNPLDNPKVNLILGDGRNHLALSKKTYDVIISEPSNPYFAGMADLFTQEYFTLMRQGLNEGGLACAWVQTYLMDKDTFQSIVAAFQSAFPEMALFKSLKGDCMMVGTKQKLTVDFSTLEDRFSLPAIQKDLQRIQINSLADFLGHLLTGPRGSFDLTRNAVVHTDDNLLAEYAAPRALMGGNILKIPLIDSLEKVRQADFSFIMNPPQGLESLARAADQINARGKVYNYFSKKRTQGIEDLAILQTAAKLNPEDSLLHEAVDRFRARAFDFFTKNQKDAAVKTYEKILTILPEDAKANYNLATLFRQSGRIETAFDHYSRAAASDPDYFQAHFNLAQIHVMKQEASRARQCYEQVLKIKPDFYPAMIGLADLLLASFRFEPGSIANALELADKAAALTNHQNLRVLLTLSTAQKNSGRINPARKTLQRGLDLSKRKKDMKAIHIFQEKLSKF